MTIFKAAGACAIAATLAIAALPSRAEPTSGAVTIAQLRPYVGGNQVFVYVNGVGPCGSGVTGSAAIYSIDLSSATGKAAYAAALTAVATGKTVQLEVIASVCGTPYPGLQSIYIGT